LHLSFDGASVDGLREDATVAVRLVGVSAARAESAGFQGIGELSARTPGSARQPITRTPLRT
jgi:hypothetical protein